MDYRVVRSKMLGPLHATEMGNKLKGTLGRLEEPCIIRKLFGTKISNIDSLRRYIFDWDNVLQKIKPFLEFTVLPPLLLISLTTRFNLKNESGDRPTPLVRVLTSQVRFFQRTLISL